MRTCWSSDENAIVPPGPATPATGAKSGCGSRPNDVIAYGPSDAGGGPLPGDASKTIVPAADAAPAPVAASVASIVRTSRRRRTCGIGFVLLALEGPEIVDVPQFPAT